MQLAKAVPVEATWPGVGVVVIGRNEGKRLEVCLRSLDWGVRQVVYVDSGSTDGSPALAASLGADVVQLDPRFPFNAGRARTEGFQRLQALVPDLRYVQFVDGDSEMLPGWFSSAVKFLDAHPDVAAVTGRLRERHPERSIYNTLCAMEWESHPVGETRACGGNAMMRAAAMDQVGSYRFDLVAGEEPELCHRLRAARWRIWQLPDGIAVHDAEMTRFSQWWRRAIRSGYGGLQGARLYGLPDLFGLRLVLSAWFWVLGVPLAALALAPWLGGWALLAFLLYPLQVVRQAILGTGKRNAVWSSAFFSLVVKFPNLLGQMQCLLHQCLRKKAQLIEYKSSPSV